MDVRSLRKRKLRKLIDEAGGQAEFARRVDTAPAYLSQLLNDHKRNVGHKFARKIEQRLELPDGWMDEGDVPSAANTRGDYIANARPAQHRYIPVLNSVQAGQAREIIDDFPAGEGIGTVGVDPDTASLLGSQAFALIIDGYSMSPDFQPGDVVIVDPDAPVRPGDIVVARVNSETNATVKKYRARGHEPDGTPVYELVPSNDDYATERIDSQHPGEIIGPVVEHRRRLRRPNGKL